MGARIGQGGEVKFESWVSDPLCFERIAKTDIFDKIIVNVINNYRKVVNPVKYEGFCFPAIKKFAARLVLKNFASV